ncbi:hypothetical protein NKH70_22895 [Mesorhizobium sp. M0991]|uniref:hypothetical protein n=1 Tax=Mesorhizobium sp. M0991 TaxID=2957043 RepID=UPI00333DC57C
MKTLEIAEFLAATMFLAASPSLADESSSCAAMIHAEGQRYIFQNQCPYPVYWSVACAVGAQMCFGSGQVFLMSGQQTSRTFPGAFEVDGPFVSH